MLPEHTVHPPPIQLLNVEQTARQLGISRAGVYKLLASGQLGAVHIGRSTRIRASDLAAFIEKLS